MKLEYHILWFDDQLDSIKPYVDRVQNALARLGFEPRIDLRIVVPENGDPRSNIPAQQDVDLILMDWKLGGGHDGAKLASHLRRNFRDIDIVFYSSESPATLRQKIFNEGIDGVICCNRTSLTERTMGLIQAQMRKILDLNHMRGIVMAATSDLDQAMIKCLEVVQSVIYPANPAAFAAIIGSQVAGSLRSKAADIERLAKNARVDKLLREPAFGAALRLTVFQNEIKKLTDQIDEIHLIETLNDYHQDVITPRNDFAHRSAIRVGDKLVLEGRDEPFDQKGMVILRMKLLNHFENLRGLLSLLEEMADIAGGPAITG